MCRFRHFWNARNKYRSYRMEIDVKKEQFMDCLLWKENRQIPEVVVPVEEQDMCLLQYPVLADTGIVEHAFTTRSGGVSEGIFSSMNLSFTRGDKEEAVLENYRRLAHAMHTSIDRFVLSDQTHTTNVRVVTEADAGKGLVKSRDYQDVDGLVTNVPGLVLSTFYADCVPLFFVDPMHHAIGLSHSGWRGTVGRMGQATIQKMQKVYGSRPEDLICAIGPSICADCYEVSADVAEEFRREFAGHEAEVVKKPHLDANGEQKYQLDLWQANRIVLLDAGVPEDHISCTTLCTCCNADMLFSHRASHGKRGNLGAFLMLKE